MIGVDILDGVVSYIARPTNNNLNIFQSMLRYYTTSQPCMVSASIPQHLEHDRIQGR